MRGRINSCWCNQPLMLDSAALTRARLFKRYWSSHTRQRSVVMLIDSAAQREHINMKASQWGLTTRSGRRAQGRAVGCQASCKSPRSAAAHDQVPRIISVRVHSNATSSSLLSLEHTIRTLSILTRCSHDHCTHVRAFLHARIERQHSVGLSLARFHLLTPIQHVTCNT